MSILFSAGSSVFRAGAQLLLAKGGSDEESFRGTWDVVQSTPFSWLWWDGRTGLRRLRGTAGQPVRRRAGVCRQWATHPGDAFFHIEGGKVPGEQM